MMQKSSILDCFSCNQNCCEFDFSISTDYTSHLLIKDSIAHLDHPNDNDFNSSGNSDFTIAAIFDEGSNVDEFNNSFATIFDPDVCCTSQDNCRRQALNNIGLVSSEEIDLLKLGNIPHNTQNKRSWALRKFNLWRTDRNKKVADLLNKPHCSNYTPEALIPEKPLHLFNVCELNYSITRFIAEIKDSNKNTFKPKTLLDLALQLQQAINQNLDTEQIKFLSDPKFKQIKGTLDAVMCNASKLGLNQPAKRADIITPEMDSCFWDTGILGHENPTQLLHTLVYLFGINFALRGGAEHSNLVMGNLKLVSENQSKSLLYTEFSGKAIQGGIKTVKREPKRVIAYQNKVNPNRCIVFLYEKYLQHRPPNVERFYLRPLLNFSHNSLWYSKQQLGYHTIQKIITNLCSKAGIPGYFTTHSLRATAATTMYRSGIPEQVITEITGHASNAVRLYKRTSCEQKLQASKVLQFHDINVPPKPKSPKLISNSSTIETELHNSSNMASVENRIEVNTCVPNENTSRIQGCCSDSSINPKMKVEIDGKLQKIFVIFE